MEKIKIRELRGSTLETYARKGELVGLMRDQALIAVVIPTAQAWVEHLIDQNWSRIKNSVREGEAEIAVSSDIATLDEVLADADGSAKPPEDRAAASPLGALWETVGAPAREMIQRLGFAGRSLDESPYVTTTSVRIRDISARRINQAGENRELLVLSHDGALIGVVVPLTNSLIDHWIRANRNRVDLNALRAEGEVAAGAAYVTVDEAVQEDDEASPNPENGQRRTAALPDVGEAHEQAHCN